MNRPSTILEVFYFLNARLLDYEDGEFMFDIDTPTESEGTGMMKSIYLNACLFDEKDILKITGKYINRIKTIYLNLDENVKSSNYEDFANHLLPLCYEELGTYLFYLDKLQSAATDDNVPSLVNDQSKVNQLHEKFDLRKVKKEAGFEGKLSAVNAAMLFYYLYKAGFSPAYSALTRGRIANALFWISAKNVTDSFEGNQPILLNKQSASELKDKLNELIAFIDSDVASGFKK